MSEQAATSGEPTEVSVLSLEDDPIYQDGLSYLVEDAGMVFHRASNKADFLAMVSTIRPTVTINDLRLEDNDRDGSGGLNVLPEIVLRSPSTRRIVLTAMPALRNLQQVLKYQVEGFLKKNRTGGSQLIAAIKKVAAGGTAFDPDLLTQLLRRSAEPGSAGGPVQLTPREREVLQLILVNGWGNKEIANHLNISEQTVSTFLKTATEKLGCGTRWQKAIRAQELGLL